MDQRGSFGRKALPGFAPEPAPSTVAPPAFTPTRASFDFAASSDPGPWLKRGLLALLTLPLAILFVDSLVSGTELITPIDHQGLVVMRWLGAADGLLLWLVVRKEDAIRNRTLGRRIIICVGLPLMMVLAFDALAWRLANWGAFGGSDAAFETASYPIKSLNHGRKGRRDSITIDPFGVGESSHIPIPSWQYSQLLGTASGQCVEVQQRRAASGAIQIKTDGQYVLQEPAPVRITSC
ncbi:MULTISPECIES: hypothetical protein [Sphingomonas]|uniref:hypothetical protein n=1 Tax=Sphingomonas TaxID=13687 RepID=UPI00126A783A|nr:MULTISPECIES: hypothetical protein [Sphingomonas]